MQQIKIYPELISWRKNKQGFVQISIRIDFHGNCAGSEKIGHQIRPEQWDRDKRIVFSSCPNADLINQLLENRINHQNKLLYNQDVLLILVVYHWQNIFCVTKHIAHTGYRKVSEVLIVQNN